MLTAHGLADDVRRAFGPDEGRRVRVPMLDVSLNVRDELLHGAEGASADRLASQDPKPRFDHVEPRRPGGGEVELDIRVCVQPFSDRGRRVGRRVVKNDVQFTSLIAPVQRLEKTQELDTGVPGGAFPDDLARSNFERRVQARQAVAAIVVGVTCRRTLSHGQQRLGSFECLDLRLLVDAQNDGVGRGVQVKSDDVADLLLGRGVTVPVTVIPTGVDLKVFAGADGSAYRRAAGIPESAFVVGHVGRLVPEKNVGFLALR